MFPIDQKNAIVIVLDSLLVISWGMPNAYEATWLYSQTKIRLMRITSNAGRQGDEVSDGTDGDGAETTPDKLELVTLHLNER